MTLEYAVSSLITVPMAAEARAAAPICCVALGEQNKPVPRRWAGRGSMSVIPTRVFRKSSPLPTPHITVYPTQAGAYTSFAHHLVQAMAIWGNRIYGERGQSREAAVPDSMVPFAACDFQLEICVVVAAQENGRSVLHLPSP